MDTYDATERARIRAVLRAYMSEKRIRLPKLHKRICAAARITPETVGFSFKTFQRFMAGSHDTGDEAVGFCARFVAGLPNQAHAFQIFGEALVAIYKTPLPPDITGTYTLTSSEGFSTQLSISSPSGGFALATEKHTAPTWRLHDGVLVSTAPGEYMILSRDRLMLSPRYITTKGDAAFVYDHARSLYQGHPDFPNYQAVFTRARK